MKRRFSHGLSAAVFFAAFTLGSPFSSLAADGVGAEGPASEVTAFSEDSFDEGAGTAENDKAEPGAFLGSFDVTAYCGCDGCSKGNALTYAGTKPKAEHTISADLGVFPLGTQLFIDGTVYTVEDTGSGVDGNHLDIYFDSHEEALDYGRQTEEVYAAG